MAYNSLLTSSCGAHTLVFWTHQDGDLYMVQQAFYVVLAFGYLADYLTDHIDSLSDGKSGDPEKGQNTIVSSQTFLIGGTSR